MDGFRFRAWRSGPGLAIEKTGVPPASLFLPNPWRHAESQFQDAEIAAG
jgi:hypothetical protein